MIFQGKTSRKLLPFFLAAAFVSSVAGICVPSIADAYTVRNADEERLSGQRMIMKHRAEGNEVSKVGRDSFLDHISRRIVAFNSDKLNFDDGQHDRWLEQVYLENDSDKGNAWSNGGVTIITRREVDLATMHEPDATKYTRAFNRGYSSGKIGAASNVASVLAHEYAHFARKDSMHVGLTNKENRGAETEADLLGMDFLVRIPEYSPGSMIYFHVVEDENGYWGGNNGDETVTDYAYPFTLDMAVNDADYLKKMSNGRVVLTHKLDKKYGQWRCLHLSVDGKNIGDDKGVLPNCVLASANERTAYLAGQIAASIKMGIWKKSALEIIEKSRLYKCNDGANAVLVAWNQDDYVGKVIMEFDYPAKAPDSSLTEEQKKEKELANTIMSLPKE